MRRLAFSIDWQDEIIRAAITLKLCSYEETGAIVAALTTSIPEVPKSGRNWDYRFCWMRDAFFVVRALNRIGATRTMEDFISYILSVSAGRLDEVRPLYGVVHTDSLEERTAPSLFGYGGDGPVRIGNAAVNQTQHDVYGSIIMHRPRGRSGRWLRPRIPSNWVNAGSAVRSVATVWPDRA